MRLVAASTITDMPTVRRIVRRAAADDYRFESIVLGVVSSDAFRKREAPEVEYRRRVEETREEMRQFCPDLEE